MPEFAPLSRKQNLQFSGHDYEECAIVVARANDQVAGVVAKQFGVGKQPLPVLRASVGEKDEFFTGTRGAGIREVLGGEAAVDSRLVQIPNLAIPTAPF